MATFYHKVFVKNRFYIRTEILTVRI